MHFIVESRRPCGHDQREMIEAKNPEEAVEIGKKNQKEICDGCALLYVLKWQASGRKEANA